MATNQILIAENVEANIKTLYIALSPHCLLTRDIARQRIVEAVITALDPDSKKRFEEYQEQNNPCKEVKDETI